MSPDVVVVTDAATTKTAFKVLRRQDEVPDQIDQMLLVDQD